MTMGQLLRQRRCGMAGPWHQHQGLGKKHSDTKPPAVATTAPAQVSQLRETRGQAGGLCDPSPGWRDHTPSRCRLRSEASPQRPTITKSEWSYPVHNRPLSTLSRTEGTSTTLSNTIPGVCGLCQSRSAGDNTESTHAVGAQPRKVPLPTSARAPRMLRAQL